MKGTGAKRNVCPGSCVSTGAKFPVAPVESVPMNMIIYSDVCLKADKQWYSKALVGPGSTVT